MNDDTMTGRRGPDAASAIGRRRFLAAVAAAAAAGLASTAHLRSGSRTRLVMAVGGAGARIAGVIPAGGLDHKIWLWNRGGLGQHVPPRADRRILLPDSVDELGDRLEREVAGLDPSVARIAVVAGFGGVAGSHFTPPIVAALDGRGVRVGVFGVLPFRFEGKPRLRAAEHARSVLEQGGVAMQVFRNDDLRAGARGRPLRAILDRSNDRIARAVRGYLLA